MLNPFLTTPSAQAGQGSAYDYSFTTLDGQELPLSKYKNKAILVVNTASKCGFTPQYEGLEALYEAYKDRGLVIIGVPSNDFGEQEPGSAKEIAEFCKLNYGVSFPMTEKQVVTGDSAHPFYKWIADELGFGAAPKWNFHKYLIDAEGKPVDFFLSTTSPESGTLKRAIERVLPKTP
ncbi:MAG: glutathione peroxidase [Rickettsiales bacterium]|nr:glutathione peroxidase [Rickettsiales bacterium]